MCRQRGTCDGKMSLKCMDRGAGHPSLGIFGCSQLLATCHYLLSALIQPDANRSFRFGLCTHGKRGKVLLVGVNGELPTP